MARFRINSDGGNHGGEGQDKKNWHVNTVKSRLEEAAGVLRAQALGSRDRPAQIKAQWPDVVQESLSAYSFGDVRRRPPVPLPAQISRADEAVCWLLWAAEEERRILWARAARIPWRRLEEMDGRSHSTLRGIQRRGLTAITVRLNYDANGDDHPHDPWGVEATPKNKK
mgnify:CR=1 FL=1